MTRRFHFGTNLKMHMTVAEVRAFVADLGPENADVYRFVLPPFTALQGLADLGRPAQIMVGAQNAHYASKGAFTGEISVDMLQALDIGLVMIGHAERRNLFLETDDIIARKAAAVLASPLRLLLCVGENLGERQADQTDKVLERQLMTALAGVSEDNIDRLMVAYEPVWSIGEYGIPATTADVVPALKTIRHVLAGLLPNAATSVPLLYGGSVNLENCADYAALDDVDGLFVGRAGWAAAGYRAVLQRAHQTWRGRWS